MLEQQTALMRGNWDNLEPWAYRWPTQHMERLNGRGTILVIDHDKAVRDFLTRFLPLYGYPVMSAATAEEAEDAKQLITPAAIDLVITDLHLHDSSEAWEGYALYHCWTALHPNLPFLLMSDLPCSQALTVLRRPAVRFLAKPFSSQVLLNTVAALVKR